MAEINVRIAEELNVKTAQVTAAVDLLADGATVPFIARYRKEKTGGLDDTQLRTLEERLHYLRALEDRRRTVVNSITEQGKMSPELLASINRAKSKVEIEDLYAPYKLKRRTKAQIAREAGLEPLAEILLKDPNCDPVSEAVAYLNPDMDIATQEAALDGARNIIIEQIAETPKIVGEQRKMLWEEGLFQSKVRKGKNAEGAKFSDYFEFNQSVNDMPSHRILALLRGRNEGVLSLGLDRELNANGQHPAQQKIMADLDIADRGRPGDKWLIDTAKQAWTKKMHKSLVGDLLARLKDGADEAAIDVFKSNLKDLLLAAPAGPRVTIGLDPGIRTGVKVAVVDQTGKLLDTTTIYPHPPRNDWNGSLAALAALCTKYKVDVIAIGNGTASRETDKLAADLIKKLPGAAPSKVIVSEAGASIYSASELAAKEFPDLDVSLRGAVSIARRLQDPLAELVKIEPKAIGVGQYQHDVNQSDLCRSLDAVVEDCVNSIGVDVNMASAPLLARVAGLNATIAQNIVDYRDANGAFKKRSQIKKVARLGPKAFEQAAGFLRIINGTNPLDASGVHPEAYKVVEKISDVTNKSLTSMIGNSVFLKTLDPMDFANDEFGVPTVLDILSELEKPGRDPRPEFKTAHFADGVEKISDIKSGMLLEGVVTNVTAFGAFIDIGVHQDGLVHVSQLADRFVKDPREVVKAGDVVKVRVTEVDIERKRIGLSMKSGPAEQRHSGGDGISKPSGKTSTKRTSSSPNKTSEDQGESAMAAAMRRAQQG